MLELNKINQNSQPNIDEVQPSPIFTELHSIFEVENHQVKPKMLYHMNQQHSIELDGIIPSHNLIKCFHKAGIMKVNLSVIKTIMLGLLAGFYVAMGAHCSLRVSQQLDSKIYDTTNGQLLKIIKASFGIKTVVLGTIFPMGLAMIVINGSELFTGNTMAVTPGLLHGDIKVKQIAKNWILVYLSNFSASILYAWLFVKVPGFFEGECGDNVALIAESKINAGFGINLLKGIGCNWMVNMAIMMGTTASSIGCKIMAMWWPIMAFVCMGYEHSVANMFFIPSGMMHGADVSIEQFLVKNLIPVTLGNIIGGSIMVGVVYTLIYYRPFKWFRKSQAEQ